MSFLFRKRAREREGERVREIRGREQSGQCEIVKQDLCFLSRADALSECLLLVGPWHNQGDNIRQFVTHLESSQKSLFRKVIILFYSHNFNRFMKLVFMVPCPNIYSSVDCPLLSLSQCVVSFEGISCLWAGVLSCPFWPLTSDINKEFFVHVCHLLNIYLYTFTPTVNLWNTQIR